jgi:hypothetical protein
MSPGLAVAAVEPEWGSQLDGDGRVGKFSRPAGPVTNVIFGLWREIPTLNKDDNN